MNLTRGYDLYLEELKSSSGLDKEEIKAILQQFSAMPDHGIASNILFYILNLHTQKYEFISKAVTALVGYSPEVFYEKGTTFLPELIHPNDFLHLTTNLFPEMNKIVSKLPGNDKSKVIFEFHYRMVHKNGKIVNCIEQSSYARFDKDNTPVLSSGMCMEASPMTKYEGVRGLVRLLKNDEQVTLYDKFFNYYDFNLTRRELQIAKHVTEGLTSAQIADKLFISHHTVLQHRKNIAKKLNAVSTSDLVRKLLEFQVV